MSFTSVTRSRWADVYIASTALLASGAGAFLVMTTLLLRLEDEGASGIQVAALVIAEALPMVALAKLTGRVADRFDSRVLLVVMGLAQVGACFALAEADTYYTILLGGVALSTATAVVQPVRQALLPSMVTRADLPKASAIGQTAGSIGMLIGPATAGLLVGAVDVQMTVRIAGFAFLATVLSGLAIRTRRGQAAPQPAAGVPAAGAVTWRFTADRLFYAVVWGLAVVVGLVSAVNVVDVFYVRGTLDSTATMFGVIGSCWTVGMLLGAWTMSRRIKPETRDGQLVRLMFTGLAGISAMVALSATVPEAYWIVPIWIIGGIGNGATNVIMGTLLGRRIPAEVRGRAVAGMQARVQGGALLGFVAAGVTLELLEPRWIILIAGSLGVLGVLAVLPSVRRAIARDPEPASVSSASETRPDPRAASETLPASEPRPTILQPASGTLPASDTQPGAESATVLKSADDQPVPA